MDTDQNPGDLLMQCTIHRDSDTVILESRLVRVQEVPRKDEIRFFLVIDNANTLSRERISDSAALSLLDGYRLATPIQEMTREELMIEAFARRAQVHQLLNTANTLREARDQLCNVVRTMFELAAKPCGNGDFFEYRRAVRAVREQVGMPADEDHT